MSWRKTGYFAAHRLIGSRVGDYYQEFLDLHAGDPAQIDALRDQRLDEVLSHAAQEVPFYRERVKGARPKLVDFPIVRKSDLIGHFTKFMTPGLKDEFTSGRKPGVYSWIPVKSGGTTGEPVTVIHDRDFRDRGRASRLFSQYLCGIPLGTPHFLLWGSMKDINDMRDSTAKRVLNFFQSAHLLNAFRMDEQRLEEFIRLIDESPIEHMMGYVDAAHALVRFARRRKVRLRRLKSFMACAGTVTDDIRQALTEGLASHIHNKYGTRECTDMACEGENGRINLYSHHTHLETVDETGRPVGAGSPGRILVTLLGNHSFPLIRYEVGDIGVLADDRAAHLSPWPRLDRVEGRTTAVLYDTRGNYVSPVYIRHLIGVVHNPEAIQRFQLCQQTKTHFELLLQISPETETSKADEIGAAIDRDLRAVLGADAQIKVVRVAQIEESASGKFDYIRNLLHREPAP